MTNFTISGNNLYDEASIIKNYNEYNFNWDELDHEVASLKNETAADTTLAPAVTELQTAIKSKNKNSVRQAVNQYVTEFSSATFANLASAGILALVKAFLP